MSSFMQLPDVCSYQSINYTITVEEVDSDETAEITWMGSYNHQGSGAVSHDIRGLKKNHRYSVKVQVNSIAGSSESNEYYFSKSVICCSALSCNVIFEVCLLYTSPSPRDATLSRMPSSA